MMYRLSAISQKNSIGIWIVMTLYCYTQVICYLVKNHIVTIFCPLLWMILP